LNVSVLGSKRPILPAFIFAEPHDALRIDFQTAGHDSARLVYLNELAGLGIHFANLAVFRKIP